jgi:hypothetical protein
MPLPPTSQASVRTREPLVARDVADYSAVTRRPTSGARVVPELARSLFALGCPALVREMFGVRCEPDVRGRVFTSFVERKAMADVPHTSSSFRLRAVEAFLFCLGFGLTRDARSGGLRLGFARTRNTEAWSAGEVQCAHTVDARTLKPAAGGLCCPTIFGAKSGSLFDAPPPLRFGHIRSPVTLVPWPMQPLVRTLLGEDAERLLAESARDRGMALRARLSAIEPRSVGASADLDFGDLLVNDVPVLPLALRPTELLANGVWGLTDINDLYRSLVFQVRRYDRLVELAAHERMLTRQHAAIQQAYDALLANSRLDNPVVSVGTERRLFDMTELLVARLHTGPRHLDYSAEAGALVDPQLPPGRAKVPRRCLLGMMKPLLCGVAMEAGLASSLGEAESAIAKGSNEATVDTWLGSLLEERPILLSHHDRIVAVRAEPCDSPLVRLGRSDAERLGTHSTLAIHFPLSERAMREATDVLAGTTRPPVKLRDSGWVASVTSSTTPLDVLLSNTLRTPLDIRESLQAILLDGAGSKDDQP